MKKGKFSEPVPGLPEKLREVRLAVPMTQVEAAEATGIPQNSLSTYETGAITPTIQTLYTIAKAYRVDVCELLPKSNEQPSAQLGQKVATPAAKAKNSKKAVRRKAAP